jgi:hypothetical protein
LSPQQREKVVFLVKFENTGFEKPAAMSLTEQLFFVIIIGGSPLLLDNSNRVARFF